MSISTLTNMLIANVAAGPADSKPALAKDATGITPAAATQKTTTDNISTTALKKPPGESSGQFQSTLSEKIDSQITQKSQSKSEIGAETPPEQVVSAANQEQPVSSQEPIAPDSSRDKATDTNMDSSAHQQAEVDILAQSAQSVTVSEAFQLSALLAQASEPVAVEPGQTVSADSDQTVPATPQIENEPVQLTTDQNQIDSEVVLPDSSPDILATGTDQPQGKTILVTNAGGNQQTGRELITDAITDAVAVESKTTVTDEKPPIVGIHNASESPRTTSLNDGLPVTEPKVSVAQSQLVEISSQDSTAIVEKPTNGEIEVPQQGQLLSESSADDGKDLQPAENNLSGQAALKDLDPAQVQISAGQPKDRDGLNSDSSSDSDTGQFSQMISSNELQPLTTEQTFVSGQPASDSAGVSPSLGQQIQESISSSLSQGEQQITISLNPPELGKVFIKFQTEADEITGVLEVSRAQTRYEVEQALPEVIRNLADSGIEVGRLEVVISDAEQSQQQATKDQSLTSGQNGWFDQDSSQNSDTPSNNPENADTNQWLTNIYDDTGLTEPQQMLVTGESINMLM